MDHFVGVWWSGSDDDARGGGKAAKGYLAMNFSGLGSNYPAIQDIKKYVVDKGKSQVEKDKFADTFYDRGVFNSVLIAEAIRNAQKITGKKVVTGPDVRRGLESLNINQARWKELGPARLRHQRPRDLHRPQRSQPGLHAAMGRRQVGRRSPIGSSP